mmetsp:Transcript_37832/g.118716  ORF Transcript_37832/g.118716 Transcript_37832/m.118716 type:complete len:226 (+) Transcript_37832:1261-1938(+)
MPSCAASAAARRATQSPHPLGLRHEPTPRLTWVGDSRSGAAPPPPPSLLASARGAPVACRASPAPPPRPPPPEPLFCRCEPCSAQRSAQTRRPWASAAMTPRGQPAVTVVSARHRRPLPPQLRWRPPPPRSRTRWQCRSSILRAPPCCPPPPRASRRDRAARARRAPRATGRAQCGGRRPDGAPRRGPAHVRRAAWARSSRRPRAPPLEPARVRVGRALSRDAPP